MNNMIEEKRIRTVKMGERGQIVIPEDMRKDMGIEGNSVLVLIEKGNEIVVKKEADVLAQMEESHFWKAEAEHSLEKLWGNKNDEIWDKLHAEGKI